MQFLDGSVLASIGYSDVNKALVIVGSNKRGAMYGLFNISEHIGVSAWVYMADAVPAEYVAVYLDEKLLEFGSNGMYLAKEPSVKYRGFFINDESPSFTGWGLYYHLDGHVGTGAYEWVSSTQLEHIWDQLTMAYDYNVRNIWVVNVGDIKPVEIELNYAMDIAYDMDRWGRENTADEYRFYADEEDDYTFTMYTTTTNNISKPSGWGYVPVELFYGISVDGYMQHVNSLPDGKYISYAADGDNRWRDGIMNNIHVNTIRNQT